MLSGDNYHVPAFIAAGFFFVLLLTTFLLDETHPKDGKQAARKPAFSIAELFPFAPKASYWISAPAALPSADCIWRDGAISFNLHAGDSWSVCFSKCNHLCLCRVLHHSCAGENDRHLEQEMGRWTASEKRSGAAGHRVSDDCDDSHQVIPTTRRRPCSNALEHPHTLAGDDSSAHHLAVPLPNDHDKGWLVSVGCFLPLCRWQSGRDIASGLIHF